MPSCAPRRGIEGLGADQSDLLADGEEEQQWWMRRFARGEFFDGVQDDGESGAVVRAEIGGAIGAQDAIGEDRRMRAARRHAIHVGVEQERRLSVALGGDAWHTGDQVACGVLGRRETQAGEAITQVGADVALVAGDAGNARERDQGLANLHFEGRRLVIGLDMWHRSPSFGGVLRHTIGGRDGSPTRSAASGVNTHAPRCYPLFRG